MTNHMIKQCKLYAGSHKRQIKLYSVFSDHVNSIKTFVST